MSPIPCLHLRNPMGFRKFLAQLSNSQQPGDTGSTDPVTVPPRPRSQLAIRSSESTSQTLQRRKSDSKQTRPSIRIQFLQFDCARQAEPRQRSHRFPAITSPFLISMNPNPRSPRAPSTTPLLQTRTSRIGSRLYTPLQDSSSI